MNKQGLKIASINGAEVLKIKEGRSADIKYTGIFANSMLLDKLKTLGLNISKQGSTKDIIGVEFDYGYTSLEANDLVKEYKQIKKDSKKGNSNINKIEKEIKDKNNRIDETENELVELEDELEEMKEYNNSNEYQIDNKIIKSIAAKINTKINKLANLKSDINSLKYELSLNYFCIESENKELEKLNLEQNIMNRDTLRDLLYEEGFSLDTYKTVKGEKVFDKTINYVFWFRSPSKCKGGECIFINVELFEAIDKWQRMDITLKEDEEGNVMLIEMEAYKSLVSSHIVGYENINSFNEVLVLNDLDSYSDEEEIIKVMRDDLTGKTISKICKEKLKNIIWDGASLIQGGKGFKVLRNHFFKTCAFCSDFQQFFKDYYKDKYETAYITDRYNRKVKVSEIKLITTENSMKWEKFLGHTKEAYEYWAEHVQADGNRFGICKIDHESKYGKYQRASYQIVNSLPTNDNSELDELFNVTLEYFNKLQNDELTFIDYLKTTASDCNNNKLLVDIYENKNKGIVNSYMFKEAKKSVLYNFKQNLRKSKIFVEGDNLTVIANPYMLLLYAVGELDNKITDNIIEGYEDTTLPILKDGYSCYTEQFADNVEIGAFRNPHNSCSNIMYYINNYSDEMKTYFNFGNNVISVNLIKNGLTSRGNGFDEDSDFFLCSSTKVLVDMCKMAQKYPTIVNGFEDGDKKKYKNTMKDLSTIDTNLALSKNTIGTSSNVAQLYLTQYWNRLAEIEEIESNNSLGDMDYEYIELLKSNAENLFNNNAILSVLAQVSIDNCKKIVQVGTGANGLSNEIERLRRELPNRAKPIFWQYTSSIIKKDTVEKQLKNKDQVAWNKLKDKERKILINEEIENIKSKLVDYKCPVNYLEKKIDMVQDSNYGKRISDSEFIIMHGDKNTQDRKQATKIEKLVEDFNDITVFINITDDIEDEETNYYYSTLYEEYMDKIRGLNIKLDTMSLLISRALDKDNKFIKSNSHIKTKLLNMLYKYNRDNFIDCFISE